MNIGFDEIKAMEALESINTSYNKMMDVVEDFQKSGIEVLCQNWKSNKGKEKITDLVNKLNIVLEKTTYNLATIFDVVNRKAEAIDADSDGIGYEKVDFKSQDVSFSAANAENDADNGKIAQWDLNETNKAVERIRTFLTSKVKRNLGDIELEMNNLEAAFEYSESGKSIAMSLHKITEKMEQFTNRIEKSMDVWEDEYIEDAKAHGQNVEELSEKDVSLDLDF